MTRPNTHLNLIDATLSWLDRAADDPAVRRFQMRLYEQRDRVLAKSEPRPKAAPR